MKPINPDNAAEESVAEDGDFDDESVTSSTSMSHNEFLSGKLQEEEPKGILKNAGCYENFKSTEKRLVFADDTVGGSDTETTYSSISEDELEHSVTRTVSEEVAKDFSTQIVHHLVRKTIRRRKQGEADSGGGVDDDTEDETSDSETENEFLQSLSVTNTRDVRDSTDATMIGRSKDSVADTEEGTDKGEQNENDTVKTNSKPSSCDKTTMNNDVNRNGDIVNVNVNTNRDLNTKGGCEGNVMEEKKGKQTDSHIDDIGNSAVVDVTFLGKLVRTQVKEIYTYIYNFCLVLKKMLNKKEFTDSYASSYCVKVCLRICQDHKNQYFSRQSSI